MNIEFYKYQGTGNDFVLIDNRNEFFNKQNTKQIERLCHRKFGIGADGLILLENSLSYDFKMIYYNSDGSQGSMCGNGGRCIVAFAKLLNIITNKTTFEAIDGLHQATIKNDLVKLQMTAVSSIIQKESYLFLNTGSPHHVTFKNNIADLNVKKQGALIRYGKPYNEEGTNVNFVEQLNNSTFKIRTYERGVEDETLSCGTGAVAVALAAYKANKTTLNLINLETLGGKLAVSFSYDNNHYNKIFLIGLATLVFKGNLEI
jgi:diaminopimelate epimerase